MSIKEFYKNKKVLITGHTGFKGSWLSLWLNLLGAEVLGYSLKPNTIPSMFQELKIEKRMAKSVIGDILDFKKLSKTFESFKPDIVFHLAAQPIVRLSYYEPIKTYQTNVIGTLNVLEGARKCASAKAFVNVTTDKCYENVEKFEGYIEDDRLGGYDMYSSSKACSEILSASYRKSFLSDNGYNLATARAGNVIGGGDWAQDRLLVDCIEAIVDNKDIEIRNPNSIRPWQFVLEPLFGYLLLAEKLYNSSEFAQSFNFAPSKNNNINVSEVAKKVVEIYGKGRVVVNKKDNLHENNLLFLNSDKARKMLGWQSIYDINSALKETVEWYKHFYNKDNNLYDFTINQIKEYEEKAIGKRA